METTYEEVLIQTIDETYPKYYKQKIIKQLEKDGLVYFTEQLELLGEDNAVDLTAVEEDEQFRVCIEQSPAIVKRIEKMECENSYKYATLFSTNGFPEKPLEQLIARKLIKVFDHEDFDKDNLYKENASMITPTMYEIDENTTILKFSRLLTGFLPVEGMNKRTIKYPILVIFYKEADVIEIRFDQVKGFLKSHDEYFYAKQIETIENWIEENLGWEITAIDLNPTIEYISGLEQEEVYVSAQAMNLKGKKKAMLDTGDNDEDVLPLLGELKELLKSNRELFEASPQVTEKLDNYNEMAIHSREIKELMTINEELIEQNIQIKELLDNFILETESASDLPWISLSWKHESKSKALKVKFSFNYMQKEYSLLQYYFNNKTEMERMNYVTRYLIENKRKCDASFGDEQ